MREVFRPTYEKGKRVIATSTLGILAAIGIAGCASETETVTWGLQATCSKNESPEIRNIQSRGGYGSFQIACGNEAPVSVELVSGPDTSAEEDARQNIEVVVSDENGGILGLAEGRMSYIDIDDEAGTASVNFKDVDDIVRVAIVDQE